APITSRIRKVHDFMTVGAPTPLQHAAVHAMSFKENYYVELQKHYNEARQFLYETLLQFDFKPFLPKGAYYMIADVSNLKDKIKAKDDFDFSKKLIEKTRV